METAWFILAFVVSFGAGCIFWYKRKRLHTKGNFTEAEVMHVFKSGGHYYTVVRFVTLDNQEIVHKHDAGSFKSRFKTGDRIPLYYNPSNPRKLVFIGKSEKWTPLLLIGLSFFIAIIYFIFFRN